MFIRIVAICLAFYFSINCGYAQYARPGWFVTEEVADDFSENKVEQRASVVNDEVSIDRRAKPVSKLRHSKKQAEEKRGKSNFQILKNGFSLGNRELKLAATLLKNEYRVNQGRNFVVSPLSFYAISVLLANGVVDSSLLEFSKIFSIFRLADVSDKLKTYLLSKNNSYEWAISLWGNIFSQRYRTLIGDVIKAETWSLQGTTDTLNIWMEEKTSGNISKIVESRPVNDDELFVISSLGFYHNWDSPFDKKLTKKKVFYAADGEETSVNMMYQNGEFDYFENDFMQVVRLFFDTGDYIVFYLPRENTDFGKFVANFEDYKMMPEFQPQRLDLFVPRFQLSYNMSNLRETFAGFGVKEIFDSIYNFAKMINFDVQAKVSEIFSNVRIRIDEGILQQDLEDNVTDNNVSSAMFNANRPFIFMINQGDIIGVITVGNKLSPNELTAVQEEKVSEVAVKERKNGDPAWYENKNERGDFILKEDLKKKALSGQQAPDWRQF